MKTEAGSPANFEVKAWVALMAPAGTPPAVIGKINQDVSKALTEPDVKERFATLTFEPYAAPPAEITKNMQADSKRYGEVVKRAKISID